MSNDTKPEAAVVEAEPVEQDEIEYGIVLYVTSSGLSGAQDMSIDGGAKRPITDDEGILLLNNALERVRIGRTVREAVQVFRDMLRQGQGTQPAPGAIVGLDGQELKSGEDESGD